MMMKTLAAACGIVAGLTCAPAAQADTAGYLQTRAKLIGMMERDVQKLVRDPRGVMFRNEAIRDAGNGFWLCGEINARNIFGGYAGYQLFAAFHRSGASAVDYLFVVDDSSPKRGALIAQWEEYCMTPEERRKSSEAFVRTLRGE